MLIEDRIQRGSHEAADVLKRLRLAGHVNVSIRKSTVPDGMKTPVLDYRINSPSLSQEFAATFRFKLSQYAHELWEEREHDLSRERIKRFYRRLLRLDKILTKFKRKASVPSFPTHILAIDAMYLEQFGHVEAEYCPAGEIERPTPLPQQIEEIRQKQSMCIIYSQTSPLRLDGRFIHELVHHIQFATGLQITEDERVMLNTLERHINDSWIVSRFEEFITQAEKTERRERRTSQ